MYCTPCARLMKSITPNTSVRPAAIRNSSTPSCRPFRVWTIRRVVDISLFVKEVNGDLTLRSRHRLGEDVSKGEVACTVLAVILRDASLRSAPQDEAGAGEGKARAPPRPPR